MSYTGFNISLSSLQNMHLETVLLLYQNSVLYVNLLREGKKKKKNFRRQGVVHIMPTEL